MLQEDAAEGGEQNQLSPDDLKEAAESLKKCFGRLMDYYAESNDEAMLSVLLNGFSRDPSMMALHVKIMAQILHASMVQNASIAIAHTSKGEGNAENTVFSFIIRDPSDPWPVKAMKLLELGFVEALEDYKKSDPELN